MNPFSKDFSEINSACDICRILTERKSDEGVEQKKCCKKFKKGKRCKKCPNR